MQKHTHKLRKYIVLYYGLSYGALIEKPNELLRLFDVPHTPHGDKLRIYISRRSLKHFVESRTYQLGKNRTSEQVLTKLYFAIENVEGTILIPDIYEKISENKYRYTKHFSGSSALRVIVEQIPQTNRLEIVSIHFTRHR
jgi:hypothetical protein